MKKYIYLLFLGIIFSNTLWAQYYDTLYTKDLKNRIMVSYFQEYKTFELNIIPNKSIDSTGREALKLKSDATLYAGFAFQFKKISFALASTLPQTDSSKIKYGNQSSRNLGFSYQTNGLALSATYITQKGFYDENFQKHQFAQQENPNSFARFNNMQATWIKIDAKYYPEYKKFAIGLPSNFGIKQIKSKFSWAYRASINYLKYNQKDKKALFDQPLQAQDTQFGIFAGEYYGFNFSVSPSFYLADKQGWFLYGDVWLGGDFGKNSLQNATQTNIVWRYAIVVPETKIMMGYQGDRFVGMFHYSFVNQSFNNNKMDNSIYYHTFSLILGYRFYAPVRLML
ncbi:MAG: DUF4421 domain-containing protein [Raineya sp.]|jgi:hypothetical protein|nr:DUF4421 domain-containing protein [Raineya sp.]